MPSLPTGTITFLFTDIEGSTRLVEQLKDAYAGVLADCRRLVRTAVHERGGQEVVTEGDAVFAAFPSAREALLAAVTAQQNILRHSWPNSAAVRVRMGLHTGEARVAEGGYVGMDVHRAARICAAAHGDQILVSDVTHGLVARDLPDGVSLRDLGEHRLKDLIHPHRLFQVVVVGLPADFPPIRSLDVIPNNLPRQLTSFIGREKEMAEVKRLLSTAYLVTLTGSGGAGKTRLALQVAADAVDDYPDGVWLAEFAPITDPALVPKTVASALNVPEQPGRDMSETLVDALRPKASLLLLDNCEHLLAACREMAAALLRTCPQVRILATSREGLGIPGEAVWRVPSLSVPEDINHLQRFEEIVLGDAVRLFVDRAVASAPAFAVTSENAPAVARICQRLDGIPLAIELAAARVTVLAVEQIAARLDDRFRLLTGGSRILLPRQQTLRAMMDWSFDLLTTKERAGLSRLSVFAGGCTLEAAEVVCAGKGIVPTDVLDLLTALVDKSLVLVEEQDGEARYGLLETIRQYGMAKLRESGEAAEVQRRHRDWYLALADDAQADLGRGRHNELWRRRLAREHDNLRAALEWSETSRDGAEAGLWLAGALNFFWFLHGDWSEAQRWLERALARSGDAPPSALPRALIGAARFAYYRRDYGLASTLAEKGLALSREVGDKDACWWSLMYLGAIAMGREDFATTGAMLNECLNLSRELANDWFQGLTLAQLGIMAQYEGQFDLARAYDTQGLSLLRAVGDPWSIAYALRCDGSTALRRREYDRAVASFTESLTICHRIGDRWVSAGCLEGLARAASARGQYERAALLFGAAEALREALGFRWAVQDQAQLDDMRAHTCAALGDAAFLSAVTAGHAMELEQAIEYALADQAD